MATTTNEAASTSARSSESKVPLLEHEQDEDHQDLARRFWVESKKLWHIVGPVIFSRIASYAILVVTQAFAGHLGDLELAAISIVSNVNLGFDIGLMLGMASALETLCGQAFGRRSTTCRGFIFNVHGVFFPCVVFFSCLCFYLLHQP